MPPRCSFCAREQDEKVRLLEAGSASICNHCVLFAYQAFEAEGSLPEEGSDPGFEDPLLASTQTRMRSYRPPKSDDDSDD